jgi:hypothetical protein
MQEKRSVAACTRWLRACGYWRKQVKWAPQIKQLNFTKGHESKHQIQHRLEPKTHGMTKRWWICRCCLSPNKFEALCGRQWQVLWRWSVGATLPYSLVVRRDAIEATPVDVHSGAVELVGATSLVGRWWR